MMKYLILSMMVVFAYGQRCNFDTFHDCIKSGGSEKPSDDEGKAKFEKCFKDSGCQLLPPKEKGGKQNSEQVRQCRRTIIDRVKADVQQCVQKKYPAFKFPEPKQGQIRPEENRGAQVHRLRGPFLEHIINSSCPTPKAKSDASACVKSVQPQSETKRQDFKEIRAKICQKKTECLQKLTPNCQQELEATKAAVCQCAREKIAPQSAQLQASLKNCRPLANAGQRNGDGDRAKSREGGGNRFEGFKGKSKQTGGGEEDLVERFCKTRDPCKSN